MELIKDWGERVRAAREAAGMNQEELRKRVGRTKNQISRIENGWGIAFHRDVPPAVSQAEPPRALDKRGEGARMERNHEHQGLPSQR